MYVIVFELTMDVVSKSHDSYPTLWLTFKWMFLSKILYKIDKYLNYQNVCHLIIMQWATIWFDVKRPMDFAFKVIVELSKCLIHCWTFHKIACVSYPRLNCITDTFQMHIAKMYYNRL